MAWYSSKVTSVLKQSLARPPRGSSGALSLLSSGQQLHSCFDRPPDTFPVQSLHLTSFYLEGDCKGGTIMLSATSNAPILHLKASQICTIQLG